VYLEVERDGDVELVEELDEERVQLGREGRRAPDLREVRVRQDAVLGEGLLGREDGRHHLGEPLRVEHHDAPQLLVVVEVHLKVHESADDVERHIDTQLTAGEVEEETYE
jgi:hypothetical protein